jgi:uncharacterized protein YchJ
MDEEIRRQPAADEPCPCGSGLSYGECCGRLEGPEADEGTAQPD